MAYLPERPELNSNPLVGATNIISGKRKSNASKVRFLVTIIQLDLTWRWSTSNFLRP